MAGSLLIPPSLSVVHYHSPPSNTHGEHDALPRERHLAFTTADIAEVPLQTPLIVRAFDETTESLRRNYLPLNVYFRRLGGHSTVRQVIVPLHA